MTGFAGRILSAKILQQSCVSISGVGFTRWNPCSWPLRLRAACCAAVLLCCCISAAAFAARRADVYGMGAFRAQKVGVHEQSVEEDFDAT
jgi:hypothetical protein